MTSIFPAAELDTADLIDPPRPPASATLERFHRLQDGATETIKIGCKIYFNNDGSIRMIDARMLEKISSRHGAKRCIDKGRPPIQLTDEEYAWICKELGCP